MLNNPPLSSSDLIYYRLIAVWVLCEAMVGGIIHGLKIPISGLVVGSCAIVCICLIAWYVPHKGAIIKATMIVAIFKMMLSPQAPFPAYIAVFFQGALGELLFFNRRFFRLSCILLAVLGLLESGLQRILVLTIVYGNDLWKVVNDFIKNLTKQKVSSNYSFWICVWYAGLHLVTGFFVGWWASMLPARIKTWSQSNDYMIQVSGVASTSLPVVKRKRKKLKIGLFVIWIVLILLYLQSYFSIGDPILPSHLALKILLRSLIIVLAWIFIVGPLLKLLLQSWLKQKQTKSKQEITQVLALLPETQSIIATSWKHAAVKKGWSRFKYFSKLVLVNALQSHVENKITILTAPIQTGKTTSILEWADNRNDIWGIATPVVNGKRVFLDLQTREEFHMEALPEESETLSVGRFVFSKNNFDKAIAIIKSAVYKNGWLVIDEIGPMELRGEGFGLVLSMIIKNRNQPILLVVREGLVDKVKEHFGISNAKVVTGIDDVLIMEE